MSKRNKKGRRKAEHAQSGAASKADGRPISVGVGIVFALMLIVTVCLGSVASWRSLPAANSPMPQGTPPPLSANAPSREYVYAGSALISTVEPFREAPDDLALWRRTTGEWFVMTANQNFTGAVWGTDGDIPTPGDFDGDGKTDFAVFRPSNTSWYVVLSAGGNLIDTFGTNGDQPVVADYDGDGRSDIAVYRSSNQTWYVKRSSDGTWYGVPFGAAGDRAVIAENSGDGSADYDGDGKADIAVWRDSEARFYVLKSGDGLPTSYSIGASGDQPVVADYDGDGRADFAVRRLTDNFWRIRYSSDGSLYSEQWGIATDVSVPGRYNDAADTDAKADIAVWRPSTGVWYIRRSSNGVMRAVQFGQNGDKPVPAHWNR